MPRIVLSTISLHNVVGGLEKNIIYLANYLVDAGYTVELLTFDLPNSQSFYLLDKRIKWHCLGRSIPHQRVSFYERLLLIIRIKKVLYQENACDVLISFQHGILLRLLLAVGLGNVKVICSERNALTMYDYISSSKWNLNFGLLLFVDKITVQFPSYRNDYPRFLRGKIFDIHNPVFSTITINNVKRENLILSIGRHCSQKQFELLIKSCDKVFEKKPLWQLVIIGNGHLTKSLEDIIKQYALQDKVKLLPAVQDLSKWYQKATLYAQPSQWEGFPNAQVEAMSYGVIPIGFERTRGTADLIKNKNNGYLCKGEMNVNNFSKTILLAIDDYKNYENKSQNSQLVLKQYSVQSWKTHWQSLLKETLK